MSYRDGDKGYDVYSDGWCEQWNVTGYMDTDSSRNVPLLIPYINNYYEVVYTEEGATINDTGYGEYAFKRNLNSINTYNNGYGGLTSHSVHYYTRGFTTPPTQSDWLENLGHTPLRYIIKY